MLDYFQQIEIEDLRLQIKELETKVQSLRLSRRVLMNILELTERDKQRELDLLEKDNERLKRHNRRYAQLLMEQNRQLMVLQAEIQGIGEKGLVHTNTV